MSANSSIVVFDDFARMAAAMKGQNTTDGWDVVCSYDLSKLNAILDDKFKRGKLVSDIKGVKYWDWILELDAVKINSYEFVLSKPVLGFAANGRATLTMPITKIVRTINVYTLASAGPVENPGQYKDNVWYSKDGNTYTPLADQANPAVDDFVVHQHHWYCIASIKPAKVTTNSDQTHSLIGTVPISAVTGDNQIHAQGTVVVFKEANTNDEAHIVLHFSQSASNPATYQISPKLTDHDFNEESNLLRAIANYFSQEVSQVEYALTSIAPTPDPSGTAAITPKSFAFSAIKVGDTAGVLGTFIETSQNKGRGQSAPVFTVQGQRSSPIPKGSTASIVFSQDCIQKVLIADALGKTLSNCHVRFVNQPSGIQALISSSDIHVDVHIPQTLTYVQSVPAPPSMDGVPRPPWISYNYIRVSNDVLSSTDYPVTLTLNGNTAAVAWNIDHAGFNYELGATPLSEAGGDTDITWSADTGHKITIHISSSTGNPSKFSIDASCNVSVSPNLTFDNSTYGASITPAPPHQNCWEKFWDGDGANQVHDALQGALANFAPKISLTMPGINYFTTTNILFPGAHVFQADTAAGLQIPRDMLIVGNIGKSS